MLQNQLSRSSYRESLKVLEADIQHANTLAAAIPRAFGGVCVQMRLSYSPFAPIFLFLIQWMDCSCTYELPSYFGFLHILVYKVYVDGNTTISSYERKASLREFYSVIYPTLQQLEGDLSEPEHAKQKSRSMDMFSRKRMEERRKLSDKESEREDECGICMEACTKIVLPSCNHEMCINCYRDCLLHYSCGSLCSHCRSQAWIKEEDCIRKTRSQSCPFCRGSLKRVDSRDLWVLTCNNDVVDTMTVAKENLRRFYLYLDKLPLIIPDTLFLVYSDYII